MARVIAAARPEALRVGASGKLATMLRPLLPDRLADKLGEQAV